MLWEAAQGGFAERDRSLRPCGGSPYTVEHLRASIVGPVMPSQKIIHDGHEVFYSSSGAQTMMDDVLQCTRELGLETGVGTYGALHKMTRPRQVFLRCLSTCNC